MKQLLILTLSLFFTFNAFSQDVEIKTDTISSTTYYFIRHAEKNRSDADDKNPNLIQKGLLRAAKWSIVLEHVHFDAIYSTDYNRTKQTAQPTAERNDINITIYDPNDLNSEDFINNTKGKTVLIVGHSDSTPTFVNTVIGKEKYDHIDDSNNANLYIVTISSSGGISDTLLVIE